VEKIQEYENWLQHVECLLIDYLEYYHTNRYTKPGETVKMTSTRGI